MNNEFENNNAEFISEKENTVDNENSKKAENSVGESASAKRLRMLGDSVSEDIHLKSDEEVKGAFWPNLWFKYK